MLYLIARCPATDQQLLYSSLRLTDIIELKEELSTSNGLILTDKQRFLKGDSPAKQFEAGQKKGGGNFCCCCPINEQYAGKYTHVYNLPILSSQGRVNKIVKTLASLRKLNQNKTNLYDRMKKHKIGEFLSTLPAKELQSFFDFEMHGIQRLPALLFGQCNFNLQSLHLDSYEILTHEPLHDFMNYIKNLYEELPLHLPKEKKEKLRDIINSSFNAKEAKNGSDYRKSLLYVSTWLIEFLPNHFVTTLFVTLSEIQEISYSSDDERSPQRLLRMTNLIFQHVLIIHIYIRDNLVSLTPRKIFGVYLHAIMKHAGLQYRIVSGRSANTEKEEAMFTSIKTDTKLTSNFHSDQLVSNIII